MVMLKVCVQVMVTEVVFDIDFRATSVFGLARSATEKLKQGWQNLALKVSLSSPRRQSAPYHLTGVRGKRSWRPPLEKGLASSSLKLI